MREGIAMSPEDEKRMRRMEELLKEVVQRLEVIEGRFQREFRWAATLDAYDKWVTIKFSTEEDIKKSLNILFNVERGLPYNAVGYGLIVIPEEAIKCFEGLNFTVQSVDKGGRKAKKYEGPALLDASEQLMALKFADKKNFN